MMGFNLDSYHRRWVAKFFRVLIFYYLNVSTVLAARNITVDDQNPSINYSGPWGLSNPNRLDFGGTHMFTSSPNSTASFEFTGIAIYFLSPLWPYTVNTVISLDSGPKTLVDLVDHSGLATGGSSETVQYQVVWMATGLSNTKHNLQISVGVGQRFAVVDGFIYTVATDDVSSPLSSLQSPTSTVSDPVATSSTSTSLQPIIISPTPGASSFNSTPLSQVVVIASGSLFGVLSLFLILGVLRYLFRRRKRQTLQTVAAEEISDRLHPYQ